MQHRLWRKISVLLIFGAVLLTVWGQDSLAERDEPSTEVISGYGCVTAGVEAGCLMLTDKQNQTVYNLYFSGKKPKVGSAIRFSGTPHDGMTTCMQGRAVNVTKWFQLKMKCKPAS